MMRSRTPGCTTRLKLEICFRSLTSLCCISFRYVARKYVMFLPPNRQAISTVLSTALSINASRSLAFSMNSTTNTMPFVNSSPCVSLVDGIQHSVSSCHLVSRRLHQRCREITTRMRERRAGPRGLRLEDSKYRDVKVDKIAWIHKFEVVFFIIEMKLQSIPKSE
jgi:hypothetical protein